MMNKYLLEIAKTPNVPIIEMAKTKMGMRRESMLEIERNWEEKNQQNYMHLQNINGSIVNIFFLF